MEIRSNRPTSSLSTMCRSISVTGRWRSLSEHLSHSSYLWVPYTLGSIWGPGLAPEYACIRCRFEGFPFQVLVRSLGYVRRRQRVRAPAPPPSRELPPTAQSPFLFLAFMAPMCPTCKPVSRSSNFEESPILQRSFPTLKVPEKHGYFPR